MVQALLATWRERIPARRPVVAREALVQPLHVHVHYRRHVLVAEVYDGADAHHDGGIVRRHRRADGDLECNAVARDDCVEDDAGLDGEEARAQGARVTRTIRAACGALDDDVDVARAL